MTIISCKSLCKTYKTNSFLRRKHTALCNLNFDVEQGELIGIVGPNGAGKSTLIKAIMGFIKIDSGEILINGSPVTNPNSRNSIGYLPETNSLYKNLSVVDHLNFAAKIARVPHKERKEKISRILELVQLQHVSKSPIQKYSKGMTQRAALAYALINDPGVLILDEPMSGLDPLGRSLVIDILRQFHQRGVTILFCSHILNDVERICDRIGIMCKGKLALMTTPVDLTRTYNVRSSHLTPLEACFLDTVNPSSKQVN